MDVDLDGLVPGSTPGLTGYATLAAGDLPRAGVVVLHEAFGINDAMREHVDRIASWGYDALMPDLYTAGRACLVRVFRDMSRGRGQTYADIAAARRWLLERPEASGKVGIIGFCMGGAFALVASTDGYDVSSVNYGDLPRTPEALREACPTVGSYGAQDRRLAGTADRLRYHLDRLGVEHDIVEYPEAGHAFLNSEPLGDSWAMRWLTRVMHLGPEPASAAHAWSRIEDFFAEHLAASTAPPPLP